MTRNRRILRKVILKFTFIALQPGLDKNTGLLFAVYELKFSMASLIFLFSFMFALNNCNWPVMFKKLINYVKL